MKKRGQIYDNEFIQDVYKRQADNGRGFDTKQLDLSGGEVSLEGTREKVGLKNTHNRLTLIYFNYQGCGL